MKVFNGIIVSGKGRINAQWPGVPGWREDMVDDNMERPDGGQKGLAGRDKIRGLNHSHGQPEESKKNCTGQGFLGCRVVLKSMGEDG